MKISTEFWDVYFLMFWIVCDSLDVLGWRNSLNRVMSRPSAMHRFYVLAIFSAVSTASGLHLLPSGQTGLRLIRFNSSTQSGDKWAAKGKCMLSEWPLLPEGVIFHQDSWLLHLGDRLRILISLLWVAASLLCIYCITCLHCPETGVTDVWVCDGNTPITT